MADIQVQSQIRYIGGGRFVGDQALPNRQVLRVGAVGTVHSIPGLRAALGCSFGTFKVSLEPADVEVLEATHFPVEAAKAIARPASAPHTRPASASAGGRPASALSRPGSALQHSRGRAASLSATASPYASGRGILDPELLAKAQRRPRRSALATALAQQRHDYERPLPKGSPQLKSAALAIAAASAQSAIVSGKGGLENPLPMGIVGTGVPRRSTSPSAARQIQKAMPAAGSPQPPRRRTSRQGTVAQTQKASGATHEEKVPRAKEEGGSKSSKSAADTTQTADLIINMQNMAGEQTASIPAHLVWTLQEVAAKAAAAIKLLPGHELRLVYGEEILEPDAKVADVFKDALEKATGSTDQPPADLHGGTADAIEVPAVAASGTADGSDGANPAQTAAAAAAPAASAGAETQKPTVTLLATKVRREDGQLELDAALIQAASDANIELAKELLDAGANAAFLKRDEGVWGAYDSTAAIHKAIRVANQDRDDSKAEKGLEMVKLLLAARADINAVAGSCDWRGCGSSTSALEMGMSLAKKHRDLFGLFLESGADPNTRSERSIHSMRTDGHTVDYMINDMIRANEHDLVKMLLERSANPNAVDEAEIMNERGYNQNKKESCLHVACEHSDLAMVALLLASGADVNCLHKELDQQESPEYKRKAAKAKAKKKIMEDDPREGGYVSPVVCVPITESALHIAIRKKKPDVVEALVAAGADMSVPRICGKQETSSLDLCANDSALLAALASGAKVASDAPPPAAVPAPSPDAAAEPAAAPEGSGQAEAERSSPEVQA